MNRCELLKQLKKESCVLLRNGSRHDIYINPNFIQIDPLPNFQIVPVFVGKVIIIFLI